MSSATTSYNLHFSSITSGDLVDLPYHILQKLSILIFGLTTISIKLPSILIGIALGFLLVLLLNRWFKSNVALLASIISVLSTPFLYLSSTGTPLIMLVFWPTLLLWLGSKIQGEKRPNPIFCFIFAIALLLSVFTPHLIYLAVFIVVFALIHPHLRFTIRNLPLIPLIIASLIILGGLSILTINAFSNHAVLKTILFSEDFSFGNFFTNLKSAFVPFFSWNTTTESVYLSPLISLPSFFIAFSGLISTRKGFFASRNAIASCLIFFTIILSGFNPDSAILLILPLSILIAHGLRYILEKWYNLFPENPYARIFAIFPISLFIGIIIISDLSHYVYGYRYTPAVANNFSTDLSLISKNLPENTYLLLEENSLEFNFFKIYEDKSHKITVVSETPNDYNHLATLGEPNEQLPTNSLTAIITSPKTDNSDRIYLYEKIIDEENPSE